MIFRRLFTLLIVWTSYQAVQAANGLNSAANFDKQSYTSYRQQEPWYLHPLSVQLNSHLGYILPIELIDIVTDKPNTKNLLTLGGRADIGLLYPNKWIWEHFDCYPKLGLLLKYDHIIGNNTDEIGYIAGSVFYLEPNYDHLSGFEILPRLGIGVAYLKIPGAFSSIKKSKEDEEEEVPTNISASDVDPFREGPSLNLILDILLKYRLTPKWHLNFSIGVDYLPHLTATSTDEDTDTPAKKRSIEIYTASLGCSYTFNPSNYNPKRKLDIKRKSRIDVAFLNSFKQPHIPPSSPPQRDTDEHETTDDKYYYIGGLHVQWSLQVLKNHAFVLGTEWIKNFALKKELEKATKKDYLQASFMAGHEFWWGKLIFGQYAGIYVLNNALGPANNDPVKQYNVSHLFYVRLGINYRITDYLYVGTSLKIAILPPSIEKKPIAIDYTRIDYLDFRIGYSF